MNLEMNALAQRRRQLIAQCATQRDQVAQLAQAFKRSFVWLDIARSGIHLLRQHPWLSIGTALLLSRLPLAAFWRPFLLVKRLWKPLATTRRQP